MTINRRGRYYIVGRNQRGFASHIIGPLSPLRDAAGWTAAHRAARKDANQRDIAFLRSQGLTITIEREYPSSYSQLTVRSV